LREVAAQESFMKGIRMSVNLPHPPGHLYGRCLRNDEIPDFRLTESEYRCGLKTPFHCHEHALLCVVLAGSYTDTCRRKQFTHEPSTVFFLPQGERHLSDFSGTNVRIFRVEVNPGRLSEIREYSTVLDYPFRSAGGRLRELGFRLYREFGQKDETRPLAIEGLILEMIAEASRSSASAAPQKTPAWLRQTRDLLHGRFPEKLSLDQIARSAGVHPVYLASMFHRHYHCTVGEYVRHLRIEYACRHLRESKASIAEIALQAGFSDQSHFSKLFKRQTSMTPRQYRSRNYGSFSREFPW
jgi:AraC family transcriptional regulator